MPRAFDILPPTIKKITQPMATPRKKRKSKKSWLALFVSIFLLIVIYTLFQKNIAQNPQTKSDQNKTVQSNQFELFNKEGASTLANPNAQIKIKLLDGSKHDDFLTKMKNLLTQKGYQIISEDKSQNKYDQTIIFYPKEKLTQAQNIQNIMAKSFEAKLQEQDISTSSYDILIIIGEK